MFVRRRHAVAALVAALLLTSGCGSPASPPASPTTATTPSPADSDAAAFAAAEATYRAYVDALNAVDLADPSTFEPVYALTTGEILESDRKALSAYNASGVTISGRTEVRQVFPHSVDGNVAELYVCIDVSSVTLTNADGQSMVPPDRDPVQAMLVTAERDTQLATGARLIDVVGTAEGPTCD
ncbi:hypothetical protein [Microbacterium arborescens]|uniref:hypothetical protein n=1 Tax=Microbacterium arborescens TaxID=33883 RepID=UPI0027896EB5|nr:hypothetical protein [Microbacterium arborescens]MDQ1216593.1 hypothetical protein [Microbacterium arborescens]